MQQSDLTPLCKMQRRDFDFPLHHAAGSQILIQITPRIFNQIWKNWGYESGFKVGTSEEKNGGGKYRATVPVSPR